MFTFILCVILLPKVISEALGHSSVAFTMDTYSHIIEGMQGFEPAALAARARRVQDNGVDSHIERRKNNLGLTLYQVDTGRWIIPLRSR